jgi:hypothetical protein
MRTPKQPQAANPFVGSVQKKSGKAQPPSQLQGWKPYKGKIKSELPALGRLPDGPNPRFPMAGPEAPSLPAGGFQSIIDTRAPLDAGFTATLLANLSGPPNGASSAENASRAAFSRALSDNTNSTLRSSVADFNQQYQSQAQKSMSEDLLGQWQNTMDRFRLDSSVANQGADIWTHYDQEGKNLKQTESTEIQNEKAKQTAAWMSFLGGLI